MSIRIKTSTPLSIAVIGTTIVLATLKILGIAQLSWLWVFSPIWGLFIVAFGLFLLGITIIGIRKLLKIE